MSAIAMDVPAELKRGEGPSAVTVARGPFVILAHGLMAIAPRQRSGFWISSPQGRLTARQAEHALRN